MMNEDIELVLFEIDLNLNFDKHFPKTSFFFHNKKQNLDKEKENKRTVHTNIVVSSSFGITLRTRSAGL